MELEALTYDRTLGLLQEVVAENGADYVYTTDPKTEEKRIAEEASDRACFYGNVDGTPGCIVGHLIHKLKPDFDLSRLGGSGAISALEVAGYSAGSMFSKVSNLVLVVQRQQDGGRTWGEALTTAVNWDSVNNV